MLSRTHIIILRILSLPLLFARGQVPKWARPSQQSCIFHRSLQLAAARGQSRTQWSVSVAYSINIVLLAENCIFKDLNFLINAIFSKILINASRRDTILYRLDFLVSIVLLRQAKYMDV